MMARLRTRFVVPAAVLTLVAGCAEIPAPPEPEIVTRRPAHDDQMSDAIAKHRQQAQKQKQSGDLAAAAVQWQIVTLLDPHDDAAKRELAATQATISRRVQENYSAGVAAMRGNDMDRAADLMLAVLSLEPDNADAAKSLREIEKRRQAKVQASRAARVGATAAATGQAVAAPRAMNGAANGGGPNGNVADGYDLEQPLEMFRAGDTVDGLRDLRRYVDANPGDRAGRTRIGTVVYERALEEEKASKEQALPLFEQAVSLRGEPAPGWSAHIQGVRKALAEDYFQKGVQAYATDPALAIKQWETSLRYDPQNAKAATRLKDAQANQAKAKKS